MYYYHYTTSCGKKQPPKHKKSEDFQGIFTGIKVYILLCDDALHVKLGPGRKFLRQPFDDWSESQF
jgi:hypothetical protein